jgi:hypothetical protein
MATPENPLPDELILPPLGLGRAGIVEELPILELLLVVIVPLVFMPLVLLALTPSRSTDPVVTAVGTEFGTPLAPLLLLVLLLLVPLLVVASLSLVAYDSSSTRTLS